MIHASLGKQQENRLSRWNGWLDSYIYQKSDFLQVLIFLFAQGRAHRRVVAFPKMEIKSTDILKNI